MSNNNDLHRKITEIIHEYRRATDLVTSDDLASTIIQIVMKHERLIRIPPALIKDADIVLDHSTTVQGTLNAYSAAQRIARYIKRLTSKGENLR